MAWGTGCSGAAFGISAGLGSCRFGKVCPESSWHHAPLNHGSGVSIAATVVHFLMQISSSVVQWCIKMDLSKKAKLIIKTPNNSPPSLVLSIYGHWPVSTYGLWKQEGEISLCSCAQRLFSSPSILSAASPWHSWGGYFNLLISSM